jgi:PTH1 family peptidyl-tRNA hydrolase
LRFVVGLGNPGDRYQFSRHNIGFWVLDEYAKKCGLSFHRDRISESLVCEKTASEAPVLLIKPLTYMNRSGEAVLKLLKSFKLSPQETLVILDDIFLGLGVLRFRLKGSAGGHNGLRSILEACASTDIPRLRIGVGLPQDKSQGWVDHVLDPFSRDELEQVRETVGLTLGLVNAFVSKGAIEAQKWLSDLQSKKNLRAKREVKH